MAWEKAGWPNDEQAALLGAYTRLCADLTELDVQQTAALIRDHGDDGDRGLTVAAASWIADLLENSRTALRLGGCGAASHGPGQMPWTHGGVQP